MKRPILICTIGCIIGIILGLYFKYIVLFFLLIIIYVCYMSIPNKRYRNILFPKIYLFLLIISILFFSVYTKILLKKYDINLSEDISVIATIVSDEEEKEYYNQYIIEIHQIGNQKYKGINMIFRTKSKFSYGNKILIKGKFEKAQGQRNENGFDYNMYLKTKKIVGIIREEESIIKKQENISIYKRFIYETRKKIEQRIYKYLEKENADLLIGILLGDKTNLSDEIKESFSKNNMLHMLAVSGAHIGYMIITINFLCKKCTYKTSKIVIIVFLMFFCNLVGSTPSVTRASIMTGLAILSKLLYKKSDNINNIGLSMLFILICNPLNILDIGFLLSYAGTIGILSFYQICISKIPKIKYFYQIIDMIILCVSANIFIFPITIYKFNKVSITFVITNIILSPLIGLSIILGILFVFLNWTSYLLNPILSIIIFLSKHLQKIPLLQNLIIRPHIFFIFIYYLFLMWNLYIFYISNKEHIYLCEKKVLKYKNQVVKVICMILIILLILKIPIFNDKLKISFVDVGQGDCSIIITPNGKRILIDGGGSESFSIGKMTLIPYLLNNGIYRIDYVIISHFDTDHVRTDC